METKLPRQLVDDTLLKLTFNFPASGIGPGQAAILVDDWLADLGHLTPVQFLAAVAHHRQNSNFFPSTKQILDAAAVLAQQEQKPKMALPAGKGLIHEEQIQRNQEGCAKILRLVREAGKGKRVA